MIKIGMAETESTCIVRDDQKFRFNRNQKYRSRLTGNEKNETSIFNETINIMHEKI